MGKPGPIEYFDTPPMNIDKFIERAKLELECFCLNVKNLKGLKDKQQSLFNWYITFGFWNESLEYLDEILEIKDKDQEVK